MFALQAIRTRSRSATLTTCPTCSDPTRSWGRTRTRGSRRGACWRASSTVSPATAAATAAAATAPPPPPAPATQTCPDGSVIDATATCPPPPPPPPPPPRKASAAGNRARDKGLPSADREALLYRRGAPPSGGWLSRLCTHGNRPLLIDRVTGQFVFNPDLRMLRVDLLHVPAVDCLGEDDLTGSHVDDPEEPPSAPRACALKLAACRRRGLGRNAGRGCEVATTTTCSPPDPSDLHWVDFAPALLGQSLKSDFNRGGRGRAAAGTAGSSFRPQRCTRWRTARGG